MEQRNRLCGNDGLGYYTSWDKSKHKGCIYCGNPATTREHVPSKAFLTEPYPENLATIPACFECNNGFSNDEKYISCFLDVLKEMVYPQYKRKDSTQKLLEKDKKLKSLLDEQIRVSDGKIYYSIDEERLCRILIKLAKGHAGFEFDETCNSYSNISIQYNFSFNMNEDDIAWYEELEPMEKLPELGSRSYTLPVLVACDSNEDKSVFSLWNEVQQENYRYQVSCNRTGGICIKIVIYEMLYCRVEFD